MRLITHIWQRLSLFGRSFVATSLAVMAVTLLTFYVATWQDEKTGRETLTHQKDDDLIVLLGVVAEPVLTGDLAVLEQVLTRYVRRENMTLIRYQPDLGHAVESVSPAVFLTAPGWFVSQIGLQDVSGKAGVVLGGRNYGTLEVMLSPHMLINHAWERMLNYLKILGLVLVLYMLGIRWVLKAVLSPLTVLNGAAIQIAEGKLDLRIVPQGSPESRHAMEAFNAMAKEIERAQMRLREERELLQVVLDSVGDAVITTNLQSRIDYMNNTAETLLGCSLAEIYGKPLRSVLHLLDEKTRSPLACLAAQSVADESGTAVLSSLLKRRDGVEIPVESILSPIHSGADHDIVGAALAFRDMTRWRETESQLWNMNVILESKVTARTQELIHANQELERTVTSLRETQEQLVEAEKMASLGNLVAGISHEINTPVGVSVTSASSLKEEVSTLRHKFENGSMKRSELEGFFVHADQACNILLSNTERASALIRSFKQVAVDQSSDELRMINLRDYFDEILLSLHPKLKHASVIVVNKAAHGIEMLTHPGAIYQVMSNLVLNAVIHAYEPEQAGEIRIGAEIEGEFVVLTCQDDGAGIAPQHLKRIFDPFFTTRRGAGGTGLGLNIVYNLVTAKLRGRISVDSQLHSGTTFTLRLPNRAKEA
jgi:PAS domain S-box-containing protein